MASAKDDGKSAKTGTSGGRERRLAAALRENLRRRKTQARARNKTPGSGPPTGRPRDGGGPGPADH